MKRKLRIPKAILFVELYEESDVQAFLKLLKKHKNKSEVIRKLLRDAVK